MCLELLFLSSFLLSAQAETQDKAQFQEVGPSRAKSRLLPTTPPLGILSYFKEGEEIHSSPHAPTPGRTDVSFPGKWTTQK